MLRNRIGRIGRHPDHRKLSSCIGQIHIVVSGAPHSQHLHTVGNKDIDDFCIHRIIDKSADGIIAVGQFRSSFVELGFKEGKFHSLLPAVVFKRRLVVSLGIKKSNFHIASLQMS